MVALAELTELGCSVGRYRVDVDVYPPLVCKIPRSGRLLDFRRHRLGDLRR